MEIQSKAATTGSLQNKNPITFCHSGPSRLKFESFERINSIRETNGNFDSCNSCKRLVPSRLHELHESKFPFVSRIEFIRSKLSNFSAHVYGVAIHDKAWIPHELTKTRFSNLSCLVSILTMHFMEIFTDRPRHDRILSAKRVCVTPVLGCVTSHRFNASADFPCPWVNRSSLVSFFLPCIENSRGARTNKIVIFSAARHCSLHVKGNTREDTNTSRSGRRLLAGLTPLCRVQYVVIS